MSATLAAALSIADRLIPAAPSRAAMLGMVVLGAAGWGRHEARLNRLEPLTQYMACRAAMIDQGESPRGNPRRGGLTPRRLQVPTVRASASVTQAFRLFFERAASIATAR